MAIGKRLDWIKFDPSTWLGDSAVRSCSPMARAVFMDLMCLSSEGNPFGTLTDTIGPLSDFYLACRCCVSLRQFLIAKSELLRNGQIRQSQDGAVWVDRVLGNTPPVSISRYIPRRVRRCILAAGICLFCETTETLTVDHIYPISRGGTSSPDNLQCLCKSCNSSKGAR